MEEHFWILRTIFCRIKDLYYRLLHYSTKMNNYMHKCSKDNNLKCDHSGLREDNLHLSSYCKKKSGHIIKQYLQN